MSLYNHENNKRLHNIKVEYDAPLAQKNWFKTGGTARRYFEPRAVQEFQDIVYIAHQENLPMFILGEGANILIADSGFDGIIIRPAIKKIKHLLLNEKEALVTAQAGATLAELINYCLNNNLTGLEEFSGIPGTIGGSVYINAHYFEFLLDHFIHSATIIERGSGNIIPVEPAWFEFGYNYSRLHREEEYLIDATFKVALSLPEQTSYARGRSCEMIRHRSKRYPTSGTCGSFFRNFLPEEVTLISNNKKMIHVAYYLDKIGVKGQLACGDAAVSYQHANMLVNLGNATSSDILTVARTMQEMVYSEFNIIPQPECRLIGFKEYPLLR